MTDATRDRDRNVPDPDSATARILWLVLISVLGIVIVGALIGTIILLADGNDKTDPAILVTMGTSALTGMLGLFITPKTATAE